MRARARTLLFPLMLPIALLAGFSGLLSSPDSIIADPHRPSIDYARPGVIAPIGNDLTSIFLPRYVQIVDRLGSHGHLPRWDDSGFGGRPMIGNAQAGLFYPPAWLAHAIGRPSALCWLSVLHLLFAGAGVYALGRAQGLTRTASLVAGGLFEICPYMIAHVSEGHYPHVWTVCWYPWAFWGVLKATQGSRIGLVALPAILSLSFLAGHPQEWYYLVVALSVWWCATAFRQLRSAGIISAFVGMLPWAIVVGVSLAFSAIEILPVNEAKAWALRTSVIPLQFISHYHVQPFNLFQLVNPFALGRPSDYSGADNYWESVFSFGLTPLLLVYVGCRCDLKRRPLFGWMSLVLVSGVFATGRGLGLFSIAYALLPGMDRFRVPGRALFLASLGASVLAGAGLDAIGLSADRHARRTWIFHELLIIIGILCAFVALGMFSGEASHPGVTPDLRGVRAPGESWRKDETPTMSRVRAVARRVRREPTFWMALGGAGVLAGAFASSSRVRISATYLLPIVALAEPVFEARSLLVYAPSEVFSKSAAVGEKLLRQRKPAEGPLRVAALDELYGDLRAATDHIQKSNINDGFQIQHAADLYERLYPYLEPLPLHMMTDGFMDRAARARNADIARRVLDLMAVRFLVLDKPWPLEGEETSNGDRPSSIIENSTALPMAYVVPNAFLMDENSKRLLVRPDRPDPKQAVGLQADPLPTGPRSAYKPAIWRGSAGSYDPDNVSLRVETEAPGFLVVANTWMPGWTATVDGAVAPVLRGNHWQIVIPLASSGLHTILLSYDPPGFALGKRISIASIIGWCLFWLMPWVRRRWFLKPSRDVSGATTPGSGPR